MKIIENNILPPKGFKALTIGPFIFVKKGTKLSKKDLNHEAIHWEQYKELLIIGFLVLYALEYIVRFLFPCFITNTTGRRYSDRVYYSLSFEKEAYMYEDNYSYIENRKHFNWLKML